MKLTVSLKAEPEDKEALLSLIRRFNEACNYLSCLAFSERLFYWLPLQRRAYREIREKFQLPAAACLVAIRKVAYAYKAKRKRRVRFRPLGAIPLFAHAYRNGTVRIYGLRMPIKTRPNIPPLSGRYEGFLVYHRWNKKFVIHQVVEVPEPQPYQPQDFLGCDAGIVNLLTDSDGDGYDGQKIEEIRRIFAHRRRNLQKRGTKAARRKLRLISGRQARFQRDINHQIAKKVVSKALGHSLGIALEDLKGIRGRITARRRQRGWLANWGFGQLKSFILYKARLTGVPVVLVQAHYTSQTCPVCGFMDKGNRKSQALFICGRCFLVGEADYIAALNIRARAFGDKPMVSAFPARDKSPENPCLRGIIA